MNVVLLWHMHQPDYVHGLTGAALMPWVRLHAVKGYLDMIGALKCVPEMRAAFNFTPVLLRQIGELARGETPDVWGEWSARPAAELGAAERAGILEHFFKANWENLVRPHPRYWELLTRRGMRGDPGRFAREHELFSEADFRDLQTWFNLAWCGYEACRLYPELEELKRKGSGFTEEEKGRVLAIHREILGRLVGEYREAEAEGRIETTTTPYAHPILPLVHDTDFARRCMPGRALPRRFSAPEDAEAHVRLAVEQHAAVFGKAPAGMWPAEGSVAPEILPVLAGAGIRYFFTDEAVLFKGLARDPGWSGKRVDHLELFQGWRCEHGGASVNALFRERPLSDFIGFNAARNTAAGAASHLVHHLEHVASVAKGEGSVVALVLDGENAWESFRDGGQEFLRLFYEGVCRSRRLRAVTPGAHFAEHAPQAVCRTLHTGSWINADFDIWIGDAEENRAWELLGDTRAALVAAGPGVAEAARRAAWRELYAAEGSDWFWWYGPDFETDSDSLFDELFRSHLQAVYRHLGMAAPPALSIPICEAGAPEACTQPTSFLSPVIDGKAGSYFEWVGAGRLDVARQGSAMFQSDRRLEAVWFGNDAEALLVRVDFAGGAPSGRLRLRFLEPVSEVFILEAGAAAAGDGLERIDAAGGSGGAAAAWACGDIVEARLPLPVGAAGSRGPVRFFVELEVDGVVVERAPERGAIAAVLVAPEQEAGDWFV